MTEAVDAETTKSPVTETSEAMATEGPKDASKPNSDKLAGKMMKRNCLSS